MRSQAGLLVRCVRAALGTETGTGLCDELRVERDWGGFTRTARQHGVMPHVYRTLRAHRPAGVPPRVLRDLAEQYRAHARRSLFLTGELLEVLAAFDTHAVPAMPLKGPVLAATLYDDVTRRQFADLDILVPAERAARAAALLGASGYACTPSGDAAINAVRLGRGGRTTIDLQWALADAQARFPVRAEGLWTDTVTVPLGTATVRQPALSDQLLLLCSHPAKHSWSRLGWLADIAAFLLRYAAVLDWPRVLAEARRSGGERLLLLGLRLAGGMLHVRVPPPVQARIDEDAASATLAAQIQRRLFLVSGERLPLHGAYEELEAKVLYLRSRERCGDRLCLAGGLARWLRPLCTLRPNEQDRAAVALPGALSFLYFAIRPIRLALKYAPALIRA